MSKVIPKVKFQQRVVRPDIKKTTWVRPSTGAVEPRMVKGVSLHKVAEFRTKNKLKPKEAFPTTPKGHPGAITERVRMRVARDGLPADTPLIPKIYDIRKRAAIGLSGHFTGMLDAINDSLANPPFAAQTAANPPQMYQRSVPLMVYSLAGAPYTPRSVKVPLRSGRVQGPFPWKGLGESYAAGEGKWEGYPKSTHFWRKTGALASYFNAWVTPLIARLDNWQLFSTKIPKIQTPAKYGKLIEAQFHLEYPRITPYYMDYLLRVPFAHRRAAIFRGIEHRYLFQPGGPDDLRRFLYPEYVRPMYSLFAATVGQLSRDELYKFLRSDHLLRNL